MPNRTDLLNHLINRYGLSSYLEIGVQNPAQNFDKIKCDIKVGVDPDSKAGSDFCMTSDDFFRQWQEFRARSVAAYHSFDLVFIDGLHTAEQVKKDFENALKILSPNGFIVLHDCNPEKEEHTIVPRPTPTGHWNGDVYKFAAECGRLHDCFFTVDVDNGCGVWQNGIELFDPLVGYPIFWNYFSDKRKELLNLISWNEFIAL